VERAAREVEIDLCELREFIEGEHPTAKIEVSCSTGTYIRTLASDMGAMAGTGGMMRSLRRTWVGNATNRFALEEAHSLDALTKRSEEERLSETVLPLRLALKDWLLLPLLPSALTRLFHGQAVPFAELPEFSRSAVADSSLVGVLDTQGEVCAIAEWTENGLKPSKVLAPSDFTAVDSTPNVELVDSTPNVELVDSTPNVELKEARAYST
jgi:tRNA pseudouridine55 synthase